MPFDSTGYDHVPQRPEPSHGRPRRRRRRFVLFAALGGGVLAGGPVALLAWQAAHDPAAACDASRARPALSAPDAPRAATPAQQTTPCDTAPRATVSR